MPRTGRWFRQIIGDGVERQALGADALWFSGAMLDTRPGSPGSGAYLRGISGSFLAMGMASAAIMTDFLVKGIGPAAGAPRFPGHYSSNSYLFPAGLCERLIAKPCYLGSAFRAATLDEHAAVAHAQRVAGRELRRAAVMAERVGEQQLADMLGDLSPLPQRLDLRDALVAAELVFLHLLGDEPRDRLLAYAVGSHLPGHLLVF